MASPSGMPLPGTPEGGSSQLLNSAAQAYGIALGAPAAGPQQATGPDDPYVWMGVQRTRGRVKRAGGDQGYPVTRPGITGRQDKALRLSEVLSRFDKMDGQEKRKIAAYLALAGYLSSGGSDATFEDMDAAAMTAPMGAVRAAYEDLVKDAMDRQANLGQRITPNQLLEQAVAYRLAGSGIKWDGHFNSLHEVLPLKSLGGAGEQKPGPKDGDKKTLTQTSTARDIMDPEDAKGLTRSMLQQELGRDPTEAEYEDFIAMLQHAQRANPTTQTTTANMVYDSQSGGWRTVSDSTTTHQGIGADGLQQLAYEKAQQNPDWAEWQAMGTYAPALFEALGATVPGVGS